MNVKMSLQTEYQRNVQNFATITESTTKMLAPMLLFSADDKSMEYLKKSALSSSSLFKELSQADC